MTKLLPTQTLWDRVVTAWPMLRDMALFAAGLWWGQVTISDPGPVDWGNVTIVAGCLGLTLAFRQDERRARREQEPERPSVNGSASEDRSRWSEPG